MASPPLCTLNSATLKKLDVFQDGRTTIATVTMKCSAGLVQFTIKNPRSITDGKSLTKTDLHKLLDEKIDEMQLLAGVVRWQCGDMRGAIRGNVTIAK